LCPFSECPGQAIVTGAVAPARPLRWLPVDSRLTGRKNGAFPDKKVFKAMGAVAQEADRPSCREPLTARTDAAHYAKVQMTAFRPEDEVREILAAIVESSDDAIIGKDLDGMILTWNRGAERLYGYTAQEIIGRSISVLIPEGQSDDLAGVLGRVRAGYRVDHYETVRRAKDGRLVDVSLTVSPIKGETGQVVGASAIARDISARNRAEVALRGSEARWRSTIESAVDGIVIIDARGLIEAFNPAAERLFGYAERDVVGRNVNMLMPAPYHEEHDAYVARYLATGAPKIIGIGREVTGLRRDGTTFPLHLSVGEMSIGRERKFTGILYDLSVRVRMEEQLREQTELARLGEMAAVIAHEVKNPLAGVRGAIQVIGTRLPADGKDGVIVKEIVARIDALNDLMEDMLLFARPPQPKPAPVEIAALVHATADLLNSDPAHRDVHVQVDGSAEGIVADADLLTIVFENLLVNGAQAMRGRGTIRVAITVTGTTCQVAFTDTGPGIPAEARDKIFTPFFTTKARGSGLGLPIARRLIEAHRGTISITCQPPGGTTVTVQLPAEGTATP
jgi:two-component system sensor kinase FixL